MTAPGENSVFREAVENGASSAAETGTFVNLEDGFSGAAETRAFARQSRTLQGGSRDGLGEAIKGAYLHRSDCDSIVNLNGNEDRSNCDADVNLIGDQDRSDSGAHVNLIGYRQRSDSDADVNLIVTGTGQTPTPT